MDKSQLLLFFSDSIPDKWNLSDCFSDADQFGQQVFQQVEFQHVGAVTLGYGGIFVGFAEPSVSISGTTGFGYGLDKLRHTSRDATGLVGLLQGVGYIQDDGETEGLHFGDAAIVDD